MIITIDGPVGTGKSTVAKKLAETLGFIYFDTGAMYRCLTYGVIKHHIDVYNSAQLSDFLKTFTFDIKMIRGERHYFVDDEDITDKIRQEEVTSLVSKVSAISQVRENLVKIQRSFGQGINAVFEGRDMGTVVFPNADLKIYLTGDQEIRARRRYDELRAKYPKKTQDLTFEKVLEDVNRRDVYDTTREVSPLSKAEDAQEINTTKLSVEQVVGKILNIIS